MPNKKAQRNNNRKTKRAPPKPGKVITQLDKIKNCLLQRRSDCSAPTCNMCESIMNVVDDIDTHQAHGLTTLQELEHRGGGDDYAFNIKQLLGIRPNGRVGWVGQGNTRDASPLEIVGDNAKAMYFRREA